jgi:hypothetical protein
MRRALILNKACAATSAVCLSLAYLLSGYWLIILVFLAMTLFWKLLKNWSIFRTSSALLALFVVVAAIGVTLDLSTPLILIAGTAALTSWDLTNFVESATDNQRAETKRRLENFHLRSLAIASSAGLLLSLITSYANFELPFGVTLLLVLIAIGGITYGLQPLAKNL